LQREVYGWDDETFDGIDWATIGRAREKLTHTKKKHTCKIMHGWLPTMSMIVHITGNKQCPGCSCNKKTIDHMILCSHHPMGKKRKEMIAALRKKGLDNKIPQSVLNAICAMLKSYFNNKMNYVHANYHPSIKAAIEAQLKIGINFLVRGYFVT